MTNEENVYKVSLTKEKYEEVMRDLNEVLDKHNVNLEIESVVRLFEFKTLDKQENGAETTEETPSEDETN